MKNELYITDITSPFFSVHIKHETKTINWSKIQFEYLEKNIDNIEYKKKIKKRIIYYLKKIKRIGYNSISIDDLSHLVVFDFYDEILKNKIPHSMINCII